MHSICHRSQNEFVRVDVVGIDVARFVVGLFVDEGVVIFVGSIVVVDVGSDAVVGGTYIVGAAVVGSGKIISA